MTDEQKLTHLLKVLKNYAEMEHCYNKYGVDFNPNDYTSGDVAFEVGADYGEIMFARTLLESIEVDYVYPFIIPEKPKTLDDIQQEFGDKIDELIEKTKEKFEYSKVFAEKRYKYEFDKIIRDFEYAVKNGSFPAKLNLTCGIGVSGIIGSTSPETNLYSGIIGSISPETDLHVDTCFVIKQGNKHEGYYTFGNGRYFKYYMPTKPNMIVRFFMKTCLALRWVDENDT